MLAAAALLVTAGAATGRNSAGPAMTAGPTVIGTAVAGKRLTGLSGTWAAYGSIGYRFQWYRCNAAGGQCLSIHGATAPSYALAARDVGKTIGLTVFATDSSGTSSAYSSLVGPIAPSRPLLESTAQPVVAGPPVVGKTVQVSSGTWSPVPAKITYAWERCSPNGRNCAAIPNQTGNTYAIGAQDLGHSLLAIVQATNGPSIQNAFSTATPAVVDDSVKGPIMLAGPTVGGETTQGGQLSAGTGIWKGVGPVAFAFHWYRCDTTGSHCSSVHGVTRSTYKLGARDVGRTIALTLRAIDSTGATVAYSSLVGPVAATDSPLAVTTPPTISGTATTGGTLSAISGLWSTTPTGYGYAWFRCSVSGRRCTAIPGATSKSYLLTAADKGHTLVVAVTARARKVTQTALTAATPPIT